MIRYLLPFFILLLVTSSADAQKTWDGDAGDNLWSSGANWNPDGVPGDADDVVISGTYTVSVTSSDSCQSLQIIATNANNSTVNLIIENSARLGVGQDVDMDDRDRQNNRAIIDVQDGGVLFVSGDLNMTKDNGTSNDNDMLLRLADDDSRVTVAGTINANFAGNNNNGNQMGFILTESSGISADSMFINLGGGQESNTLISMNAGGTDGDSAFINVATGILIQNNAGNMDCIVDMDYESSIQASNSIVYSATAGESFRCFLDRDAQILAGEDFNIIKDGNEEVFVYLNQNATGSANDAQIQVGDRFEILKTDGDDCFVRLSGSADIVAGGDVQINTSNEDDNGDDVNVILTDGSGISAGDDIRFFLNDNNAVDLLITLSDSSSITTVDEFTIDFNNATLFELEINDNCTVDVGSNFQLDNTTSSSIPVLDMDDNAVMTVGGDLIWNDDNTVSDNNSGFFLDRDAALSVTGGFLITKNTDGDLNLYLNQAAAGMVSDAQISANHLIIAKDNGDDIDIRLSEGSGITLLDDFSINAANQDGNNDDVIIDLTDDASVDVPGDFTVFVSDNNGVDYFMQLNDNSSVQVGDSMFIEFDNATFFEIEMNDASQLDVGNDFIFQNTTTSSQALLDMDNTSSFTVADDFRWFDNNTDNGGTQGLFLDRDAVLDVTDTLEAVLTEDGNFFIYLNQNNDGSAADAQLSASNLLISKTSGDDLFIYLNDGSNINLDNDFTINSTSQDGDDDDIQIDLTDDAGITVPGDMKISYFDNNRVDLFIQLNDNASITVSDSFEVTQSNATLFELEMNGASSFDIGSDFAFSNTASSSQPIIDLDNTSSLTIGEDLIWRDNSNVNNAASGFFMDRDATMTVTDSIYVVKNNNGDFHFFLNQAADGATNDAQVSCSAFEIDADGLDQIFIRLANDADIQVANAVLIDAQDSEQDDHIELTMNDDAGFNIGADLDIILNTTALTDIDWNLATTDSLNIGGSANLDLQDGDDIVLDISESTVVNIGDDWTMSVANADNLLVDVYEDASVIVADRITSTVSLNSDLLQFDMDNNGSISCVDFMAVQNSNETVIDNGIFLDRDASITVTDSIYWQQFNEGNLLFYLNNAEDGSSADAQISCNSFTVEKDQGDFLGIRLFFDADLTITNDLTVTATNHEANDDVEVRIDDDAAIDVNGDAIVSNTGGTTSSLLIYQFSTGDFDVAGDMSLTSETEIIDIDLRSTGDLLVGGSLTTTLSNGTNIDIDAIDDGDIIIADDFSSQLINSQTWRADLFDNSSMSVTDRFSVTTDGAASIVELDLDSNASFSAEDVIVLNNGDGGGNSGIFLDRDATFTVNDSIVWTQTRNGASLFYLNNNAAGFAADAQLSASNFILTRDSGTLINIITSDGADIDITGDWIINAEEMGDGQHLTFNQLQNSSMTVGGVLDLDVNNSSGLNNDIRFNLSSSDDFTVGGSVTANIPNGDDFDVNYSGDGDWSVGGDFVVNVGDADIIEFTLTNDADLSITGDLDLRNTNTNSRYIRLDLDNTSSIDVGEDLTIRNATSDNGDSESALLLDRDAALTVGDSIYILHNGNDVVNIQLNSNTAGTTDATLSAEFLEIDFDAGDDVLIDLNQDAVMDINQDMVIDFGTPEGTNDFMRIRLDNSSVLDVGGSMSVNYNNGFAGTGQDFTFDVNGTSQVNVGPSAGPYNTESMTLTLSAGDDLFVRLDDGAVMNVYGDLNIVKTGGDDVDLRLNDAAGTTAELNVLGNVVWDNTADDDFMFFNLNQSSLADIEGDFDLTGIDAQGISEIQMDDDAILEIAGNFLFNASPNNFTSLDMNNNSILEWNGATVQQFIPPSDGGGTDTWEYQNIVLNNSTASVPQFVMAGDASILQSVDFLDGVLYSSADSLLTLVDNATVSNQKDASHVFGPVEKIGNDTFSFPVGNGEQYRPCAISAPGAASDAILAQYFSENPWEIFGSTREASLIRLSTREYWNISQTAGTPNVQITLSWDTNSGGVGDEDSLRVAHFVAGIWEDEGNSATSGNLTSGRVTSTNSIATFSPFTLASTNDVNPLPVQLITFEAEPIGDRVTLLTWETAIEFNNERFDVQRSLDGVQFKTIGSVVGAGNSAKAIDYSFVDNEASEGLNYYRLVQFDFDGQQDSSEVRTVYFERVNDQIELSLYPNPTSDGVVNITSSDAYFHSDMEFEVLDIMGRMIPCDVSISDQLVTVQLGNIAAGHYILHLFDQRNDLIFKLKVIEP